MTLGTIDPSTLIALKIYGSIMAPYRDWSNMSFLTSSMPDFVLNSTG